MNWYKSLNRSKLTPPSWVFAPAWTILYITIFISFVVLVKDGTTGGDINTKIPQLLLFCLQLGLNLVWPKLFFGKHLIGLSLIDILLLWVVIFFTIISFWQVSHLAAILLIPYFLWVSFASYLNYKIFVLN